MEKVPVSGGKEELDGKVELGGKVELRGKVELGGKVEERVLVSSGVELGGKGGASQTDQLGVLRGSVGSKQYW